MVTAGSVVPDALLMLLRAVSHVGFPAIDRMAQREAAHELIANLLGDDAGRGDGAAMRVPIHQCIVRIAEFRKRQSIDEDLPGIESREDTVDGAAHGDGGGYADVEAVDLANGGRRDGNAKSALANAGNQSLPLGRAQELRVAKARDALDVGRKDDRRGHHGTRERSATNLIHTDQEVTDGPAGFFLAKGRSGRRGAGHGE